MPPKRYNPFKIPEKLLNDPSLNQVIQTCLPENYNFEIHKTIWRIRCLKAKCVALQMPEGLLRFGTILSEIFKRYGTQAYKIENETLDQVVEETLSCDLDVVILGDVTYGACCIDDFTAEAMGADLLVHYGHSCLIPVESLSVLYVFVDIQFDMGHFIDSVKNLFAVSSCFGLCSTIQFVTSLPAIKNSLEECGFQITIPQRLPLSPGELLGCTSPKIPGVDFLLFIGDGRFHLESAMLANPSLPAYMYDPYNKTLTKESYDHVTMREIRRHAIDVAKGAQSYGIILGTLGRQGSPQIVQFLQKRIAELGRKSVVVLLSELSPDQLKLFGDKVDVWVQVACPRISIDWGLGFEKPLLTPYEVSVALGLTNKPDWSDENPYPTDYYAYDSLGPWTPNHPNNRSNVKIPSLRRTKLPTCDCKHPDNMCDFISDA